MARTVVIGGGVVGLSAEPGVLEKVLAIGDGWRDAEVPAPDRAGLLELVGA
jgi:hypothetical protein